MPWAPGGGRSHGAGRRSTAGSGCVGEVNGEGERLTDRGPNAAAGVGHKLSKKKVNVLRHARVRMLLPCPYATPWGLRLDLLSGPVLLPCPPGSGRQGHGCEAVVGGPGARRRQGTKGGLSREGQEKVEVCLWLATDGEG